MEPEDLDNRFAYHAPSPEQATAYLGIRGQARQLAATIEDFALDGREKSLAITALEEAVMWANAAIARHGLRP